MKYYYQIEGLQRNNIGDVLQGLAAKAFLPKDALIANREALADMDNNEEGLLLANGWFMHSFEKFPPPENITPLYVSIHIADSKIFKEAKVREHFMKHSPIGCRDKKTLHLFWGYGIPAYYSGCLTITTQKRAEINTSGKGEILLVDNIDHPAPEKIKLKLEKLLGQPIVRISHDPPNKDVDFQKYAQSSEDHMDNLLSRYCKASLVITTKIHCALPCLGMGANVLMIHPNPQEKRLAPLAEFLKIFSYEEIMETQDLNIPKPNKNAISSKKVFLSNIISKSISEGRNIVSVPDHPEFNSLRLRSIRRAKCFRLCMKALYKIGIAKKRINRVYGHGL